MAGLCLRLCRAGHAEFVAVAGDEVGLDLDLVLRGPGIDLLLHDGVPAGNPVIPEADVEFAGGARGSDVNQRQRTGRGPEFQGPAT